ncbi:MAG: DUF2975 domain-containing protein [Verrucomicrobia bacterium]|nr:DUF2975 domain-containing protein [Verrucomicrobiota bacterium]
MGPRYTDHRTASVDRGANSNGQVVSFPDAKPHRRIIVDLAGKSPYVGSFDIDTGPSGLIEGREWLARICAFAEMSYKVLGALLFFRLFCAYENGHVFELYTIRRLRSIGFWMIGTWGIFLFFQFSKYHWSVNPSAELSPTGSFLSGIFIFLIAWITEEAHRIEKDVELTV